MGRIGLWTKAIIALLAAALNSSLTALQDGHITPSEWVSIVVAALVALVALSVVKNAQSGPLSYLRAGLAALVAAGGALTTGFADGHLSGNELIIVFLALLSALPVAIAPDAAESDQIRLARRAAPDL